MISRHAARQIVGIVGNVISFALFLSPCPTFYKILKKKDVEGFKPDPYLATVLNCLMWVFYGMPFVHPDSLLVITINGVGLVLELVYLIIYCTYTNGKGRKKVGLILVGEVVFMGVVVVATLLGAHSFKSRSMIVGILCVIFNVAMYTSPLTIMGKVIKSKSVKYMPFFLSFTNTCNGLTWTSYALLQLDLYMLTSNGLGAVAGIAQLILYGCYFRSTPVHEEETDDVKPSRSGNAVELSTAV